MYILLVTTTFRLLYKRIFINNNNNYDNVTTIMVGWTDSRDYTFFFLCIILSYIIRSIRRSAIYGEELIILFLKANASRRGSRDGERFTSSSRQ